MKALLFSLNYITYILFYLMKLNEISEKQQNNEANNYVRCNEGAFKALFPRYVQDTHARRAVRSTQLLDKYRAVNPRFTYSGPFICRTIASVSSSLRNFDEIALYKTRVTLYISAILVLLEIWTVCRFL